MKKKDKNAGTELQNTIEIITGLSYCIIVIVGFILFFSSGNLLQFLLRLVLLISVFFIVMIVYKICNAIGQMADDIHHICKGKEHDDYSDFIDYSSESSSQNGDIIFTNGKYDSVYTVSNDSAFPQKRNRKRNI